MRSFLVFVDDVLIPMFIAIFLVAVVMVLIVSAVIFGLSRPTCYATGNAMNLEPDWGFWQGCIVTAEDGRKMLLDDYRQKQIEQKLRIRVDE